MVALWLWFEWWFTWNIGPLYRRIIAILGTQVLMTLAIIGTPLAGIGAWSGYMLSASMFTGWLMICSLLVFNSLMTAVQMGGLDQIPGSWPLAIALLALNFGVGFAVIVPLLLSAGYHVHVDLAEAASTTGIDARVTGALGPDPRLVTVLLRRLSEAGVTFDDGDTRVVLAAAGSSDARATADCLTTGEALAAALGVPVTVGFVSAATPRLTDAVAEARAQGGRVVVATYLLAPGYFADLVAASGADVVTAPLLRTDQDPPAELVELVSDRFDLAR